jgi:hypothetical protein
MSKLYLPKTKIDINNEAAFELWKIELQHKQAGVCLAVAIPDTVTVEDLKLGKMKFVICSCGIKPENIKAALLAAAESIHTEAADFLNVPIAKA